MPDINLISISPSQLSGSGQFELYEVSRFNKKYLLRRLVLDWARSLLVDHELASADGTFQLGGGRELRQIGGVLLSYMTDKSGMRCRLKKATATYPVPGARLWCGSPESSFLGIALSRAGYVIAAS